MDDSTNLQPPGFGPTLPVYPHLRQLVRVTGSVGPVYIGYVQQWAGTAFRDREQVYIVEPNGIAVPNATVKGRLNGSHTGTVGTLPLYVTTLACCIQLSSSSSSSSSVSVSSRSPSSPSPSPSSSPSSPSPASVPSAPSSSVSGPSPPLCCLGPCPHLSLLKVGGDAGAPDFFDICLSPIGNDTYQGTAVLYSTGKTYTVTLTGDCGLASNFQLTVTFADGSHQSYGADPGSDCANILFDNVEIGAIYGAHIEDDTTCCSSLSSGSLASPPPSSAASPTPSSAGPSPPPSSAVSPNVCCPNLPGQLGLYITCAPPESISSGVWKPLQTVDNAAPQGFDAECVYCAQPSPASWSFFGSGFTGDFACFNGLWTALSALRGTCDWISDPADPCQMEVSIDADCVVTMTLTNRANNAHIVYQGKLGGQGGFGNCGCCQPLAVAFVSFGGQGNFPTLIDALTPDCGQVVVSSSSSPSATVSSCSCQPCDGVCLTQQADGSYIGQGCDATFQVICNAQGNGAVDYQLIVTIGNVTETYQAQPGSACDPFGALFFNVIAPCGEWHITINTNAAPCSSSSSSSSSSVSRRSPSSAGPSSPSSVSIASPSLISASSISPPSVISISSSSSATGTISTSCCPNLLPNPLKMSLSAIGGCPLNNATATLTFGIGPSGNPGWSGVDNSTCALTWEVYCKGGTWAFAVYKNPPIPCAVTQSSPTVQCEPFNFSITLTNFPSNCCASCSTVIVTIS